MIVRRLLLVSLLGASSPALAAADPADAIAAGSARVAAAEPALAAAEKDPASLAALIDAVGAYEDAVASLASGVSEADGRALALSDGFTARRMEIMRLVAALETLGRTPVPMRGVHPDGPLGAARAAAMMDRLEPALRTEAQSLAAEVAALRAAQAVEAQGDAALAAAETRLSGARSALATALLAASSAAEAPQAPELTALARRSESLSELAAGLAAADAAPAPPAAAPPGPLLWPVEGKVVRHFDERDASGARRPGLVLGTSPHAIVRAPIDAVVRYAGPFLEYGYVAVIEASPATMVVLAGLAQMHVQAGATVKRGDLLGVMGGSSPDVEESDPQAIEAGTGPSETLYIEIRQGKGPVDPEPLFQGDNG